jgi:hypothetical protein
MFRKCLAGGINRTARIGYLEVFRPDQAREQVHEQTDGDDGDKYLVHGSLLLPGIRQIDIYGTKAEKTDCNDDEHEIVHGSP